MDAPRDTLAVALDARAKGIAAVPVRPGTKVPAVAWKRWQAELPPEELLREWFSGTRTNIAIVCTGMVLFDCDDPATADLVLEECGDTPHRVRTPRGGIHLGYRRRVGVLMKNLVKIKGMDVDVRTDGGLEVIPPSTTEYGSYAWLGDGLIPIAELPVARVGWTRERSRKQTVRCLAEPGGADVMARRARGYLATIEGAVSGRRGHDRTFRVACVLTHKFGLGFEAAWPLLREWNERCEPPWSDAELRHKLDDALKKRG